jgi:hypothetical protein
MRTPLLAALLLVVACGSAPTGPAATTPTPRTGPSGYAVVVTEKDHFATLRAGQKLEVALKANSGMSAWSRPVSSNKAALAPTVDPAATAIRGTTLAAFIAQSPGKAFVTASATPLCSPGQACPMYAMELAIEVTVTA